MQLPYSLIRLPNSPEDDHDIKAACTCPDAYCVYCPDGEISDDHTPPVHTSFAGW